MPQGRIKEIRTVPSVEEANKLLQEGFDLFSTQTKTEGKGGMGLWYVMVKREWNLPQP